MRQENRQFMALRCVKAFKAFKQLMMDTLYEYVIFVTPLMVGTSKEPPFINVYLHMVFVRCGFAATRSRNALVAVKAEGRDGNATLHPTLDLPSSVLLILGHSGSNI